MLLGRSLLLLSFVCFSILWCWGISQDTKNVPSSDVSSPVAASNNNSFYQDPSNSRIEDVSYTYFFIKSLFVLAVFAGIGYGVSRYFKHKTKQLMPVGGPIEILYSYPMGVGRSLDVLKVVNEVMLVSNTQERVELLCKIEEKEAIDLFKMERDRREAMGNSFFLDVFSKYVKVGKKDALDVTKSLKDRIDAMRK